MECIYQIRNIRNGKVYIGSTKGFKRRVSQHKYRLNHNMMTRSQLQRDWLDYGRDCFVFEVLIETAGMTAERKAELELEYINQNGGLNSPLNYNIFEPVAIKKSGINKLQDVSTGVTRSKESIEKQKTTMRDEGHPMKGFKHSEETKERMRQAKLGKKRGPMSEETKNKIRETLLSK